MKGKILIVDDEANVREVLAVFLEGLGFEVAQVSNGTMVLPGVREHHPDLVLCDLVMPGINGLQALRQLRQEFPEQKVIMMSGMQEEEAAKEAKALGAIDYIAKPVSLDRLENEYIRPIFANSN